jgi:hypothetical protein
VMFFDTPRFTYVPKCSRSIPFENRITTQDPGCRLYDRINCFGKDALEARLDACLYRMKGYNDSEISGRF